MEKPAWQPSAATIRAAKITAFTDWLAAERGMHFADYDALWRWSVEDLEGFLGAVWDYFAIPATTPRSCVLAAAGMPGPRRHDPDDRRYRESYFDMYPGLWRHGDWIRITPHGGAVIYGRSGATINRQGIRMGTSELYRAAKELHEILDSLVVDLKFLGRKSCMPLLVVLRPGHELTTPQLEATLKERIKVALSARHVPNEIFQVAEIPRTVSGNKMELPVKKLLLGHALDNIANPDAMANPASLQWFVNFAARRAAMEHAT